MTVTANDRRKGPYPGNNVATVFNGPMAYSADDVQVFLIASTGAVTLVPPSAYQVDNVGREAGTRITMDTAPTNLQAVLILRTVALAQEVDISNQGRFNADVIEKADDLLAMQIQQIADGTILLIFDEDSQAFVWDARGYRIINVGNPIGEFDAVNLSSMWSYVEAVLSGGGVVGVVPVVFFMLGDGVTAAQPIPGADVSEPAMYRTYVETGEATGLWNAQRPGLDYTIQLDPNDTDSTTMVFATPIGDGVRAFSVLTGYARPWTGPQPITTVAIETEVVTNNTTIGRAAYQGRRIVVDEAADVTITLRENNGDADEDWRDGDWVMLLRKGVGRVIVAAEGGGTVTPPDEFQNEARAQGSTIAVTVSDPANGVWESSGDLLRDAVNPAQFPIRLIDRSVLIATNIASGTGKDSFTAPFDIQLDTIANRGVTGQLEVAQSTGNIFTFDIKIGPPGGSMTSIFSTLPTIDNTEFSTETAATPAVYSVAFSGASRIIPAGYSVRLDITQIGTALAKGFSATLRGQRAS